jgi:hypothetical protein
MERFKTLSILYFEIWFGILLFILIIGFLFLDISMGFKLNVAETTNEEGLGSYLMSCTPLDRNLFISFMATIIVFSISKIDYVPTTFICWLGSMYMYYRYGFAEHTGLFTIIWIVVAVLSIHPARYANNHFDDLLSRSDHYRNSSSRLVRLRWGYVFNRYFAYCFGFNILISMLCVQIMQIF